MKRHNLISLISVIFLLLVGTAMRGDASTRALLEAARDGDIKTVKALLDSGDVKNRDVQDAFYFASARGHIEIMRFLLDRGANVNAMKGNALYTAAQEGKIEAVRFLLDRGANIDAKSDSPDDWTALHIAASNGKNDVVRLLIDRGADPSLASKKGKTPLKIAQEKGYTIIVRMLMYAEEKQFKKYTKEDKKSSPETTSLQTVKSDVDELPAIKAKLNRNSYAIVIGIENYRQKLPKADYAVADAKTMTEYLTKVMGYPEENVVTLTNEHATKSDFEKYIEKWLPNNVEKDGSVFIYYSGHGAPNTKTGDAYLVPYDGDPSFIEQTGYPLKKLYESLNKLQAKEIIVALDSCFSGAGGKSVIAKGARPLVMNLEHDIKLSKNMIVMSASSGDQISSTYEEKGHGLFTYFMLKGIKDGITEIGELFDYLKPHVGRTARKVYNNEQTPQLIAPEKKKVFLRN